MDAFTAYEGILAAEANGFHLNEEVANDVLRESIKNNACNVLVSPMMKSEDEITDADKEWAETHICAVDNNEVDKDYLNYLGLVEYQHLYLLVLMSSLSLCYLFLV